MGETVFSMPRQAAEAGKRESTMSAELTIRIKHLYISPGHNFFGHHEKPPGENPMIEKTELLLHAGRGIEGDRFLDHKPDYKGQITFFAEEVYEDLCARLRVWDKSSSVFRRNVITRGVDLRALIGKEFEVQGVRFLGTEESKPCYWMNQAFGEGAEAALRGQGGLRARILADGILRAG
jgi:MOSC domain-containing protein YiiM